MYGQSAPPVLDSNLALEIMRSNRELRAALSRHCAELERLRATLHRLADEMHVSAHPMPVYQVTPDDEITGGTSNQWTAARVLIREGFTAPCRACKERQERLAAISERDIQRIAETMAARPALFKKLLARRSMERYRVELEPGERGCIRLVMSRELDWGSVTGVTRGMEFMPDDPDIAVLRAYEMLLLKMDDPLHSHMEEWEEDDLDLKIDACMREDA